MPNEAKRFAISSSYKALVQTHYIWEGIMIRKDDEEAGLLDLDDANGAEICKSYLCCFEGLLNSVRLKKYDRSYRKQFLHSYQILYKQMLEQSSSECAYFPEILDSAQ